VANDNARFAAILLAVAFPVAVWIGADYLTQQEMEDPNGSAGDPRAIARAAGAPRSATPAPPLAPRPPEIRREHGIEQALAAQPPVVTTGTIHKCRVQGQIVYSDQPCSAGTDLNSFAPSLAAVPVVATSRSVVPPSRPAMQAQPVGQSQPVEQVAAGDVAEIEKAQREAECRKIDEQIVSIDARMRQPYYASEGDWLKERRKALNDRRFSLGC
jgi:hypothetical protein